MEAPLNTILPSLIPVALEKGLIGYENISFENTDEKKLTKKEMRPIITAATYIGALNYASSQGFDWDSVSEVFEYSLADINELSTEEVEDALILVQQFLGHKTIMENHPFDDWICSIWWDNYQVINYSYPSELSHAISYCLGMQEILKQCKLTNS